MRRHARRRLVATNHGGASRGPVELDFDTEETAILETAGTGGVDLMVEESGNPGLLAEHLAEVEDMPVLHLSCHGHNAYRITPAAELGPALMLLRRRIVRARCRTTYVLPTEYKGGFRRYDVIDLTQKLSTVATAESEFSNLRAGL